MPKPRRLTFSKKYDNSVKVFARTPAQQLAKIDVDNHYPLTLGETQYRIVPSEIVLPGVKRAKLKIDASYTHKSRRSGRQPKIFSPQYIAESLGHVNKNTAVDIKLGGKTYTMVRHDTPLIGQTRSPAPKPKAAKRAFAIGATNTGGADLHDTSPINDNPAPKRIENFESYKWSAFVMERENDGRDVTAYDHVTKNDGIAVIRFKNRKMPIGFALPRSAMKEECIETKSRRPLSHVQSDMGSKWAKNPYKADIFTIDHRDKPPFIYVTLGAALGLQKEGFFDKAPDWVQDILQKTAAEKAKLDKKAAGLDITEDNPAAPKTTEHAEPTHQIADNTIVTNAPNASWTNETMVMLTQALHKARTAQKVVEIKVAGQDVFLTRDRSTIQSMETMITLGQEMGVEAPDITRMDYVPSNMETALSALKGAWRITGEEGNSVVILQSPDSDPIAMSQRKDLMKATIT